MTKFKLLLSSAVVLGALSGAASAQDVLASNPEGIVALINEFGYEATLTTDNTGDPKIELKTGDTGSEIFFYGCANNADCEAIQFVAGFDLANGSTFEEMNAWNKDNRFAEAYLDDENDPFVEYDLDLNGGGISRDNFRSIVDGWAGTVGMFSGYIGF